MCFWPIPFYNTLVWAANKNTTQKCSKTGIWRISTWYLEVPRLENHGHCALIIPWQSDQNVFEDSCHDNIIFHIYEKNEVGTM